MRVVDLLNSGADIKTVGGKVCHNIIHSPTVSDSARLHNKCLHAYLQTKLLVYSTYY